MTEKTDFAARLRELSKAATPGPWEVGDPYQLDGVGFGHGEGECAMCNRSKPILEGRFDINGKTMAAHLHREKDYSGGHAIVAFDGKSEPLQVAGNYDYEDGGIVNPPDAELIVYLRNHTEAILALVEAATEVDSWYDPPGEALSKLKGALEALND